jgi:hypothetical protein
MFESYREGIEQAASDQSVVDDLNDITVEEIEITSFGFDLKAA